MKTGNKMLPLQITEIRLSTKITKKAEINYLN